MKHHLIAFAVLAASCTVAVAEEPSKIGHVYIVGNTITRDSFVREAVGMYPGQILNYTEVKSAEQRLAELGIFETRDARPTVTVIEDANSVFKDIVINVKEKATATWRLAPSLTFRDGLSLKLIWEDRNFDHDAWPSNWEEIVEGRAFRGAGEKLRVEVVTLTVGSALSLFESGCAMVGRLR